MIRALFVAGLIALAGQAALAAPSVAVANGDVVYSANGAMRTLTTGGGFVEPVIGPDGHTVAMVHDDGPSNDDFNGPPTSLWVGDGLTGGARRVVGPHPAAATAHVFESFDGPKFSLDGGYVYVSAQEWATSPAVHEVSLNSGQEHFVIDGAVTAVLRTGPYRGYLLVQRHMYHPAPECGSYNPYYVVRPDAKQTFIVPGSDKDDGETSLAAWLKKNGWQAW